ncbi:cyclic 2,3-diphosphoglycerate synthase [Thermococcus sp. 21S9]|uniref:cyclic 2,3-diphosphoglycerate synthase n=1 Tax=Thermococcus sp. 21S9 TaxID=1638223 RepID=UPI00143B0FF6|nr:cyclic 2,3-diphosphoglycerate synthase [Thermococcus sp. 21S9]NJE54157.1 GTPase [Thermococcus sp. 21S9]
MAEKKKKRVLILGAAGRDFHNFNVFFRDNPDYEVVAFTATQIPDIEGRIYPPELAGELYPNGIPIWSEDDMEKIIKEHDIDIVVFAYSDVPHEHVMHLASRAHSAGADFWLLGPKSTMLKSTKPVVAVTAIRTGCGKSQTSRKVAQLLQEMGYKVVAIRHPMPYGDLRKQVVQRFATFEDLDKYECTIEEREEYEPYIERGMVVYAGVDYEKILREAEKEADIILWDGGNNDFPFYEPDLWITVVDPHRPGHELKYHPGETNFRAADVIIINKIDTANRDDIQTVRENIEKINPNATVIEAASPIFVDNPELIKGKRVLVVEDGPTLTHGGMKYGAGYVAAKKFGAKEIIDPRPYAVGSIVETYKKYPHLDLILPAMGYGKKQIKELEETINRADADVVIMGTPVDLRRFMNLNKPAVRVKYELEEIGQPKLKDVLENWVKNCEKLKKE